MKLVIQRVSRAGVTFEGSKPHTIKKGLVVFLGVGTDDKEEDLQKYVDKMIKLRIFADENDKTNLSLSDVNGELLIISQFTLYADCKKGNRPNFLQAGSPDHANALYEKFIALCKEKVSVVETGSFGADMKVDIQNDGPFTILLGDGESF